MLHVCATWRRAARSDARVWSWVQLRRFFGEELEDHLVHWLERTANAPLEVDLTPYIRRTAFAPNRPTPYVPPESGVILTQSGLEY